MKKNFWIYFLSLMMFYTLNYLGAISEIEAKLMNSIRPLPRYVIREKGPEGRPDPLKLDRQELFMLYGLEGNLNKIGPKVLTEALILFLKGQAKHFERGKASLAQPDKDKLVYVYVLVKNILATFLKGEHDFRTVDSDGDTVLHVVFNFYTEPEHRYVLDHFLEKIEESVFSDIVNKPNKEGLTPFHFACINSGTSVISELLKRGADIHKPTEEGDTPFLLASSERASKIMELFWKKDPSVVGDKNDKSGNNALHSLVMKLSLNFFLHELEAVNFLVEKGLDVAEQNNEGNTPLHLYLAKRRLGAYFFGSRAVDILKYLTGKKREAVNVQNKKGDTPLHEAVKANSPDVVKYFLKEFNPKTNIKNEQGETPRDSAKRLSYDKIVKALGWKRHIPGF